MVMFHSYVKLPEGKNLAGKIIDEKSGPGGVNNDWHNDATMGHPETMTGDWWFPAIPKNTASTFNKKPKWGVHCFFFYINMKIYILIPHFFRHT